MIEITTLSAHDAIPAGPGRAVVVMRRFEEENPAATTIQITLTGTPEETTHPHNPDGTPMAWDTAIEAAKRVAESEGLRRIYVVDRLEGAREKDILQHGGDHSVHMDKLQDSDPEDGVRGADMRDVTRPVNDR